MYMHSQGALRLLACFDRPTKPPNPTPRQGLYDGPDRLFIPEVKFMWNKPNVAVFDIDAGKAKAVLAKVCVVWGWMDAVLVLPSRVCVCPRNTSTTHHHNPTH